MPRKIHVPAYLHHKATNQAYMKLRDGAGGHRFVYLGVHGTAESRELYQQKLAEYGAHEQKAPATITVAPTVAVIFLRFLQHADSHYRRADGTRTNEVREFRVVSTIVNEIYSRLPASDFGPLALKAVRKRMIDMGLSRGVVNQRIGRVKRVFKWAAGEELVPGSVFQSLAAVAGLQRGRCGVRDAAGVKPVDEATVAATLPFLAPHDRGLVEFQQLTGCRPGEATLIRRADIDIGSKIWLYRPSQHKGSWREKDRVIAIGPQAQDLLKRFFTPSMDDYLFRPSRAPKRRKRPNRPYTVTTYAHAIARACDRAFPPPAELAKRKIEAEPGKPAKLESTKAWLARLTPEQHAALATWRKAHRWAPNQLRHTHGTKVRKQFGLEAAQVALGHAKADVTQIYAERNLELAVKVAERLG
ncbi:MAG: tyrosine-type recombinase/integrase [Gemmataceae bacterium]